MTVEKILDHQRIRQTHRSFGFIPHRFLRDGFLSTLKKHEVQLYLFYVLAADRYGVSFYSDPRICKMINFSLHELQRTRDQLVRMDLICIQDQICQVLELPIDRVRACETSSFAALNQRLRS